MTKFSQASTVARAHPASAGERSQSGARAFAEQMRRNADDAAGEQEGKPLQRRRTFNHRFANIPVHAVAGSSLQRVAAGKFIVGDHEVAGPGQTTRSAFLAHLRTTVEELAREVLAQIGEKVDDCPYIPYWFAYYQDKDIEHIEQAIGRYAPNAMSAKDWRDCVERLAAKVREGLQKNVTAGSLEGVPQELPHDLHERDGPKAPTSPRSRDGKAVQACWDRSATESTGAQQTAAPQEELTSRGGAVKQDRTWEPHDIEAEMQFIHGGGSLANDMPIRVLDPQFGKEKITIKGHPDAPNKFVLGVPFGSDAPTQMKLPKLLDNLWGEEEIDFLYIFRLPKGTRVWCQPDSIGTGVEHACSVPARVDRAFRSNHAARKTDKLYREVNLDTNEFL